ncbi:MAG TPA: chromosome segregation protein SMC [Candidatus Acidoferrales bacterium]|nr:chromosome segregation protein SMC [Candidatus Acidoferrales bacterium]
MLRLRRVDIFGFKSFAERTRILFNGTGIAAIVGPNGCGKSNISDAILWVLGEQSAKTLRSGRMADCLFNGTASRPPSNLAEVTLTLVDPEAEAVATEPKPVSEPAADAPSEAADASDPAAAEGRKPAPDRKNRLHLKILPGEVAVSRRLYRDGTSEYYLNGELCRLRDIQELFMGTGLGPESYAIIEQGRIGQILSSRPYDRRALLEEAAGVTKYRTKRRLAEARLESARQNLLRVNDILDEISKQLNSLKRQASRARRYQELKAEGTELRRRLLATQLDQLRAAETALAAQLEANGVELTQVSTALTEREQEQATAQARQYELETTLRQEQNRAGQVLVELERAQTRLVDTRRQQGETEQRLTDLASQRQSVAGEIAATTAAVEQARALCAQLEQELTAASEEVEQLTAEAETLRQQVAALEAEQQQRRQQQAEQANQLASTRAELAQLERGLESADEHGHRFSAERDLARQESNRIRAEESKLDAALAQARGERARAQENLTAAEQALALCQEEYQAEQRRVEELRKSMATALAQQETLKELVAHRAALAEPVQKLLLGTSGGASGVEFRAVGVVADFAEIEPDYAPLLEDYLHDELEYVVVETYDAARTGVSLLRQQMAGRATFLVDSFGRFPPKLAEEVTRAPQAAGVIGPVSELVRMNGPLGSEAKRVLPKLGRTYLVDSARLAEELAREHPQHFFLATDGTCYHGRLVSGGTRNGHGSHALARELNHATERREKLEPVAYHAETTLSLLEARRRELEAELDRARQNLFAQEKNLLHLEQHRAGLAAERARWQNEETRAADQQTARDREQDAAAERLAALRQELTQQEQMLAALEQSLETESLTLLQRREQLEAAAARLADLRASSAALDERLRAARQELARLEESATRLTAEHEEQTRLQTHLEAERLRLAQELTARQNEVQQCQQEKVAQEERCQQGEADLGALRQTLLEREAALRQQRTELDAVREQRHAFEVEQARQQTDRQHAEIATQSEFGLTADDLCRQVAERLTPEEFPQLETRYQEIKQKLESIGPVNMMALEELQECEERHQFLSRQHADIVASIEDTTRAINEIDTVSAQQFEHAFNIINQNFGETFRTLFGGGTATLRLTDAENPNECGIDLICQPPGKRLQNVLLLSGGEKALTALALLIAIFRYQPSPFCILDEVDAPLDDSNVGRFTQLVAQMAPQTQFILITHNKKTMEVAPMLYGVTMQNAVTQIVSVRFDEPADEPAPVHPERSRGAAPAA